MKLIKNIILPALVLACLSFDALASAGDPAVSLVATHSVVSDTTDPSINVLPDTTDPLAVRIIAFVDSGDADPAKAGVIVLSDSTSEEEADIFASEFYNDFDTTAVHSEKFDVLNFNDSILIILSDSMHGQYVHPFNGNPTSHFGFRKSRYHLGVDINLETGDSVKTCFDGKVRIAQWSKTYGNVVVVRHSNGIETYYAHLSKLHVKVGQDVTAGDVLGLGGNTGHSHGSHLHFETRFRGQPFDPGMIIDFDRKCLKGDTYYLSKSNFKYLSDTHSVKHYSKKKKKTWYTYYTPGGAEYASADAKAKMSSVPDPIAASGVVPPGPINAPAPIEKSAPKENKPAVAKEQKVAPKTGTQNKAVTAKSGSNTYAVRKGDTLSGIAAKNGTTVAKLCTLNNIKSTAILQIGQKLRVK